MCDDNHECSKMCCEECGDCEVLVEKRLPCTHVHQIPCHMAPSDYKCSILISAELPCGHFIDDKPCYKDVALMQCPFPCEARIEKCGHACGKKCHINNYPLHLAVCTICLWYWSNNSYYLGNEMISCIVVLAQSDEELGANCVVGNKMTISLQWK